MKGECDGRELTPGAPVSVGPGGMSGLNGEGGTGVKGEQDSATRSLQVPAVVGGTQGNGTRGFRVAELTKVQDLTPAKGDLQIPSVKGSAIGSVRVPSFKGEDQEKGPGSKGDTGIREGNKELSIGRIKIPIIRKDGWDLSRAGGKKRVSHDITSGSLQVPGVEGKDQGSGTRTVNVTKEDSQGITAGVSTTVTGIMMEARRESQNSGAEIPSLAATKRMNQEGVIPEMPSEAGIKRLKKDGAPGTPDVTDGQKGSESNATDLLNTAAVKRVNQDGATGLPGVTDVKRIRQDSLTDIASVMSMPRENQNNVPETVSSAGSQSTTTSTRDIETFQTEHQESVLAMLNTAHAKTVSQGVGTDVLQMEAVKGDKQDGAMSEAEPDVKGSSEGSSVKSPVLSALMQDRDTQVLKVEAGSQAHATGNPSVPPIEKGICETPDRDKESSGMPCIKEERQDKEEGQDNGIDTEMMAVLQLCSEVNIEGKQKNLMEEEEKNVHKVCQGDGDEGEVPVCGSSGSLKIKPEMVSTETQCDGSSMSPDKGIKDEYAFVGEDDGELGECLGTCEPGKKPHKCCQCDTSFRTPYELSRHSRVHSGERPYQCPLCHRCFKRKDHVEVHTRRHVEDRRYACNDCGVCFVTSSCLLRHQRRTHQAPGTKRPGEEENGEGEGEAGDIKGDGKDQPSSKDAQKNGRRNKKNKPDSTYRPGGKTVCIIKKRNLRQRSYSFVELEDDVECFESDEEDRIPFLKVKEQRREEEEEESGSQSSQLEHSLFPPTLFNPEANLSHLLLLGEVSRLLSHSLIPGGLGEGPGTLASMGTQLGRAWGLPQDPDGDSDDSDCDPPLVACDVTFTEAEGEVAGISLPDDDAGDPQAEEVTPQIGEHKVTPKHGLLQAATKTGPCQTRHTTGPCHISPPLTPVKGEMQPDSKPSCTPSIPGKRAPATPTSNKVGGTGLAAMGEPRTAWVVPANNTKGKNTCDACRRRNEANRLAQAEKERQALAAQAALEQKQAAQNNPRNAPARSVKTEVGKNAGKPAMVARSAKPQESKSAVTRRGRKPITTKKRRPGKTGGEGNVATAMPQRPHKCHLCPFNFRSATELKRHASTHSGERPFLCELCGAGFMRKCHLQLHVRRHSGERRHACPECRMRFFTPSDLARHQAIHQAGDKPLECHLCHLTFRRAFHLERHIRRHNEAAPFACKLCGAFFSSAAALRSHDKHHRTPGPHACPDCSAAFTTATALSRHRRVHSARHHRLLRAIERHATAKSSYECVSSEGSPLSLVIRKVSATVGAPEEADAGPAKDTLAESPDLAHQDKEEKENKDKITSGLSTTDKEMEDEMKGREMAISTLPTNMETQEGEKTASILFTIDNETKGKVEGNEIIISNFSIPDQIKHDSEKITSSPSITDKIEDNREKNISSAGREKEGSETNVLSSTLINQINEESEKVTSIASMTRKAKGRRVEVREKKIPTRSSVNKEIAAKEKMNSSGHREEERAINLSALSNTKAGKDVANHKEASVFPCMNSGRETGNKSIPREAEKVQESSSKNGTVSSEELNGKPDLGLSPMSKERKEAEGGSSCSLLLPTSREMEAVKEEIHCRSTYHLAAPSGGQEAALHGGAGYPSEQDGDRGSTEDSGQQGGMRDGVTTTS